jgi:small basic protein
MSEFEMAYLLNDIQLAITANSSMLFTIVSAFLVASYVVAHRLSPLMIGILLGIYAYAFLGTALAIERQMASMFGLGYQIATQAAAGNQLHWHAFANPWAPPSERSVLPMATLLFSCTVFVGSIVFFFHCRRVNRKAEAGAWRPKA